MSHFPLTITTLAWCSLLSTALRVEFREFDSIVGIWLVRYPGLHWSFDFLKSEAILFSCGAQYGKSKLREIYCESRKWDTDLGGVYS